MRGELTDAAQGAQHTRKRKRRVAVVVALRCAHQGASRAGTPHAAARRVAHRR
jgi:hypothetical protein